MEKVKDTIYRQAAIDVAVKSADPYYKDSITEELMNLPSAQTERKRGKWIYITDGHYEYFKCDQCEKHSGEPTPFCRYCGADMREGQDDNRRI